MIGGPTRGHPSRSRGLAELKKRFAPADFVAFLKKRHAPGAPAAALEIGCGEGRALLDLLKKVPGTRLAGLNKEPWQAMTGTASLAELALREGVFTAGELDHAGLPEIAFGDASTLPWPDETFDLVYSQVAIHYVARKDRVLEETWRVLKPGGRAFLHFDTRKDDAADFLRFPAPRFIVYRRGRALPLAAVLKKTVPRAFAITCREIERRGKTDMHILMEKTARGPLDLGLRFDPVSSFDLHRLHTETLRYDAYWGHRSVYTLE